MYEDQTQTKEVYIISKAQSVKKIIYLYGLDSTKRSVHRGSHQSKK
jgi:hypothetical protein